MDMVTAKLRVRDALDIMEGGYRLQINDGKIRIVKESDVC